MYHRDSDRNGAEWEALFNRVRSWGDLVDMSHHIEAKALAVLSLARRMTCSAFKLGTDVGWKRVFVETSTMIFPMLELIGFARLGDGNSDECLCSGCEWLIDHESLPIGNRYQADDPRLDTLVPFMVDHHAGPRISEMIVLRNYFLHGLKNVRNPNIPIADIVNYEIPLAVVNLATTRIKQYWEQLRNDDGHSLWIDRLAQADIQPFIVQGSGVFEQGLVDQDILIWLSFPNTDCSDMYAEIPRWLRLPGS
jgi:hypothetical protein